MNKYLKKIASISNQHPNSRTPLSSYIDPYNSDTNEDETESESEVAAVDVPDEDVANQAPIFGFVRT